MARADFNFSFPFRVRYSEIDKQGIVFNAHYLTYFDTAISEYFRALEHNPESAQAHKNTDFHTVRTLIDYKAKIHFDDEIEVGVRAGKIGRSSLTFMLEIHPKDQDEVLAYGEIVWVNTDQDTNIPEPVPAALADVMRRFDSAA